MSSKDYTSRTLYTILIALLIMLGIMFIPGYTKGNISIKRANIVSELIHFDDEMDSKPKMAEELIQSLDSTFIAELPNDIKDAIQNEIESMNLENSTEYIPISEDDFDSSYTHIEDYSHDSMMFKFYKALENESSSRNIRIAFCGDSYIEADIITSDLREMFQEHYGGQGVGFVPFSHPLLKYRSTISSSSVGWVNYSAMKRKNIPEQYQSDMYISGCISVPSDNNARCSYKGSNKKKFLNSFSNASIYFKNGADNRLDITVNDTLNLSYDISAKDYIQKIQIDREINSLSLTVKNKDKFVGYGICFDGDNGVSVDNYSIRGNSGVCLFYSNKDVNSQINKFLNYDLIVLQYGLNVASDDILDYSKYREQLKRIIAYCQLCFPNSAIIVMGVSDRVKNDNGQLRTLNGISALIKEQRRAAQETGVAFWNTFDAMGGSRSIVDFVQKGWAGKDYTHINNKGGRYIASQLYTSFTSEIERYSSRIAFEKSSTITPVKPNDIPLLESKNEKAINMIYKYDRSRHKLVSRRAWYRIKKW